MKLKPLVAALVALLLYLPAMPTGSRFAPPVDKALHLASGALIYSVLALPTGLSTLGLAAVTVAGVAKELVDSTKADNRFDSKDLAVTVVGGLAAYFFHKIALCLWLLAFAVRKQGSSAQVIAADRSD